MSFQSPNHTQVPNDLWDMLPDMTDAELRVTLVIARATLGWHRETVKLSTSEMVRLTGLSANGVAAGTQAAELRGTIERVVDGRKTAEWRLKYDKKRRRASSASEEANDGLPQPVMKPSSASEEALPQPLRNSSAIKERLKETIKEKDVVVVENSIFDFYASEMGITLTPFQTEKIKTEVEEHGEPLFRRAVEYAALHGWRKWPVVKFYLDSAQTYTEAWLIDAIAISDANNAKSHSYTAAILTDWKQNGRHSREEHHHGKNNRRHQTPEAKPTPEPEPVSTPEDDAFWAAHIARRYQDRNV